METIYIVKFITITKMLKRTGKILTKTLTPKIMAKKHTTGTYLEPRIRS